MNAPRILDPRAVPVHSTDAHLPPVAVERLRADWIRSHLADTTGWAPEWPGRWCAFQCHA